jgi:hypothetical protein
MKYCLGQFEGQPEWEPHSGVDKEKGGERVASESGKE